MSYLMKTAEILQRVGSLRGDTPDQSVEIMWKVLIDYDGWELLHIRYCPTCVSFTAGQGMVLVPLTPHTSLHSLFKVDASQQLG